MALISTPTPSHAITTERMDVRALWEVYAANPPEIRTMPLSARSAAEAKTVAVRVRAETDLAERVRALAGAVTLLALAAWGGYFVTTRAAQSVAAARAPVVAPAAPARAAAPSLQKEAPVVMTIELGDDAVRPTDAPGAAAPATVRRAAPKKFRVANDADMSAAARANQASQQALDSSLR